MQLYRRTPELAMSFAGRLDIEVIPAVLQSAAMQARIGLPTPYVCSLNADMELKRHHTATPRHGSNRTTETPLHHTISCAARDCATTPCTRPATSRSTVSIWFSVQHGMFMLSKKPQFEPPGGFNEGALYAEDYLLSKRFPTAVRHRSLMHPHHQRARHMGISKSLASS